MRRRKGNILGLAPVAPPGDASPRGAISGDAADATDVLRDVRLLLPPPEPPASSGSGVQEEEHAGERSGAREGSLGTSARADGTT